MTRWRVALLVVGALAAGPAAAQEFALSQELIAARVKKVALGVPRFETEHAIPPGYRTRIERALATRLSAAKLAWVGSGAYEDTWRELSETLGGTYDPATGEPREDTWQPAREHTLRELKRIHEADAVLEWGLIETNVGFEFENHFFKQWWSVGDQVLERNGARLAGKEPVREVRGFIAWVRLVDTRGVALYEHATTLDWSSFRVDTLVEQRPADQIQVGS